MGWYKPASARHGSQAPLGKDWGVTNEHARCGIAASFLTGGLELGI